MVNLSFVCLLLFVDPLSELLEVLDELEHPLAVVFGVFDQLKHVLASVERSLQPRIGQVLLEHDLIQRLLQQVVKVQVRVLLIVHGLSAKLKLKQEAHELGLFCDALMSKHVKLFFLAHKDPKRETLFVHDDQTLDLLEQSALVLVILIEFRLLLFLDLLFASDLLLRALLRFLFLCLLLGLKLFFFLL